MPYKDPEKLREHNKRYKAANRETISAKNKLYYLNNRHRILKRKRDRYAALTATPPVPGASSGSD